MKCPLGTDEEFNLYLEGYDVFKGEWKYINNELRYLKECKTCPNYKQCDEWIGELKC